MVTIFKEIVSETKKMSKTGIKILVGHAILELLIQICKILF